MHMTNVNTYTWSLTQFVIFVSSLFVPFILSLSFILRCSVGGGKEGGGFADREKVCFWWYGIKCVLVKVQ